VFGRSQKTTLAKRWAFLFLTIMVLLLGSSLFCAFLATSSETLLAELEKQDERGKQVVKEIRDLLARAPAEIGPETNFNDHTLKPESRSWIVSLRERLIDLYVVADTIYEKTNTTVFRLLTWSAYSKCEPGQTPFTDQCYIKGEITEATGLKEVTGNTTNYYNFFETERFVRTKLDQARTRLTLIKSYFLPALLGMLGACTFVVRTISDQIKDITFSRTSPFRHALRVALGSIVGVVIVTFYDAPSVVQLSASAWAFIAGYAMESVFAAFDFVAGKLRS